MYTSAALDALKRLHLSNEKTEDVRSIYLNGKLIKAVDSGSIHVIKKTLADGADPNATNANGYTALMIAASNANIDAMATLLEHGANINATRGGNTVLMLLLDIHDYFIQLESEQTLALANLLLSYSPDLSIKDDDNRSALSMCLGMASLHGRKELKTMLDNHLDKLLMDRILALAESNPKDFEAERQAILDAALFDAVFTNNPEKQIALIDLGANAASSYRGIADKEKRLRKGVTFSDYLLIEFNHRYSDIIIKNILLLIDNNITLTPKIDSKNWTNLLDYAKRFGIDEHSRD